MIYYRCIFTAVIVVDVLSVVVPYNDNYHVVDVIVKHHDADDYYTM